MKIDTTDPNTSGFVPEPGMETPPDNSGKLKLLCLILTLLIVVLGLRTFFGVRSANENLANQKTEISELKAQIAELKGEGDKEPAKEPTQEEGTMVKDSEAAGTFLKKLLTWNNAEEYRGVRNWLLESGVAATDPLLTEFMPELSEAQIGDANMKCGEVTTYRIGEEEGRRDYFAICRVTNKIDNHEGNGKVAVFYSVSDGGDLSGVSVHVLEG